MSIEGPAECPCAISDNGDGTCTAKFTPKVPGKYEIGVKYGEDKTHVPSLSVRCFSNVLAQILLSSARWTIPSIRSPST